MDSLGSTNTQAKILLHTISPNNKKSKKRYEKTNHVERDNSGWIF